MTADLESLRAQIDDLDARLHDLLMARGRLAAQVRAAKAPGSAVYRPGREADVLRRLHARHQGDLPYATIARMWRELMSATTRLQDRFSVAVLRGHEAVARAHFGAGIELELLEQNRAIMDAVRRGQAAAGVIATFDWAIDHWWDDLGKDDAPIVVAKLPVFSGQCAPAFVLARPPFSPSQSDRGLLLVGAATDGPTVLKRLDEAGLKARAVIATFGARHLVEIENWVPPDDPRLAAAKDRLRFVADFLRVAGGYARPVDEV